MTVRLVIGDFHACFADLQELLAHAGLGDDDEIIAVGDILDRGPDNKAVLDFFRRRPRTLSVMGNHERKHLR
jgi:serine/threonine protein phosphatase 1